tara:strand:- start:183 stop:683 length:501 start_codon:yes stop_codon:yes gene_type:complete
MAILQIPPFTENPILREKAKPVKKVDKKLKKLIKDMAETVMSVNGAGIAAPQVEVGLAVALVRLNVDTKKELMLALINPEIFDLSEEMEDMEEGCLSVPGKWGDVSRHKSITLTFESLKGQKQTLFLKGFNARMVQHEVDHLNGILFIDRAAELHDVPQDEPQESA